MYSDILQEINTMQMAKSTTKKRNMYMITYNNDNKYMYTV